MTDLPLCPCHGPLSCFGGSATAACRLDMQPRSDSRNGATVTWCKHCEKWVDGHLCADPKTCYRNRVECGENEHN